MKTYKDGLMAAKVVVDGYVQNAGTGSSALAVELSDGIKALIDSAPEEKPRLAVGVSVLVVAESIPSPVEVSAGGRVLMSKRKERAEKAVGLLSTPGGRVEQNEDIKNCALRELFEETGLLTDRASLEVVYWQEHFRFDDHYIMFYVLVKHVWGDLETKEPEKQEPWQWVSIEELRKNPSSTTEPSEVLDLILFA